jgi:hypothetical protein
VQASLLKTNQGKQNPKNRQIRTKEIYLEDDSLLEYSVM